MKTFRRKWGLQPKIIHRMYTAIATYAALVWRILMDRETNSINRKNGSIQEQAA